jgi:hypothetical protein
MKKHLLKKSVLAFMAMFAFAVSASAEDARLLSFGFYQANNPSLSKDYVATVPAVTVGKTTYDIEVALPAGTDFTGLVAQFTVNDGNTVSVDGAAQTSGVTKNDFTDPVDYTVSNSNKSSNLRYTVTVVEESASSKAWTEISVLDATTVTGDENVTGVYSGAVLKLNPQDDAPYVVFGVRGVDNKLTVAKFDGSAWSKVGAASFTNKVSGSHYNFDIALDGTPYVAYNDQEATNKGGLSVMKFDGSAWTIVGDAGITATTAQYVGISALENSLVAVQQNNKAGDFAKRALVASFWNGTTWATEAAAEGLYGYAFIASNGKEAYILGVGASDGNKYTIVKASDKSTIVKDYLPEGATGGYVMGNSVFVAPDGTLYLLAVDDATGVAKMRLSVYKNGAFQTVGGDVLPISNEAYDRHMVVRVATAPDGTPYIAYNDYKGDKNVYFIYLDNETKQWTAPVKVADAIDETADDVNLCFTKTGIGYLTFTDKNNKIHLLKYAEVDPASVTVVRHAVAKTEYFDLSGKRVSAPAKGLYIQRSVDNNGRVKTSKVMK